jgi:hypothetical protein
MRCDESFDIFKILFLVSTSVQVSFIRFQISMNETLRMSFCRILTGFHIKVKYKRNTVESRYLVIWVI